MGWNDRPYPLLPLGDSQPFADTDTDTDTNSDTNTNSVAFALQEREGHPFAARLISRTHLADLR